MTQRRIRRDACAQQRCHCREFELVGNAQYEILVDNDVVGIAAIGLTLAAAFLGAVGTGETFFAILLKSFVTTCALLAGVDHAADTGQIAGFEAFDVGTNRDHAANDFVARHQRKYRAAPFIFCLMQIRVAHAAIFDFDHHVIRARLATLEAEWAERLFGSGVRRSRWMQPLGNLLENEIGCR